MDNIISVVSSGKLVMKRIWLGGCSGIVCTTGADGGGAAAAGAVGWLICGGTMMWGNEV